MQRTFVCLLAIMLFSMQVVQAQAELPAPKTNAKPQGASAPGSSFIINGSGNPASGAPQIAEWTRTAGPDESVIITGDALTRFSGSEEGKDMRFKVVGPGGVQSDAAIQRFDNDRAIITLPQNLNRWGMYLIYPGNDVGYGTPVAVNKTDAWWVGPDRATRGKEVSVFGRNLTNDNKEGTSNSNVYVKSKSGSSGQWAQVVKTNPFRVTFKVPESLANGEYEVWIHNGHGGDYGWSGPIKLEITGTISWNNKTINVKDYGARGDGWTDDAAAINRAIAAAGANFNTLYFPAGNYVIGSPLKVLDNTRWLGETGSNGKPAATIGLKYSFLGANGGIFSYTPHMKKMAFENLTFAANGHQVKSNGDFIDLGRPVDFIWNNCIVDAPGLNCFRFGWADQVYITNSTFIGGATQWGSVMFIDGGRQYFIDNNTFLMTGDCGAAMLNKVVTEVSVTNNTIKDYDNSVWNGWGKGRIWSHTGNDGSASKGYFAQNQGLELGVRPNGPDQNSGEIFLWEANAVTWSGTPGNSTATTTNLPGFYNPQKEQMAVIVSGKGIGQSRKIVGIQGSTITVDEPWNVIPDQTSRISVGSFVDKNVVYKNYLHGKARMIEQGEYTASGGVVPYGGVFNLVVSNNTFHRLKVGIANYAIQHGNATDVVYFPMYVDNTMESCRFGLYNATEVSSRPEAALLGATYRNNTVNNPVQVGIHNDVKYETGEIVSLFVYEYNKFNNTPRAFATGRLGNPDPRVDFGSSAVTDHLLYKNTFNGPGTGVRITPGLVVRENQFKGFAPAYHSASVKGFSKAPQHVIELEAKAGSSEAKTNFTVWNSGNAPATWSLRSDASWLSISETSGRLEGEDQQSVVQLTAKSAGLQKGTHKATLWLTTQNGNTSAYSVVFKVADQAPAPPPTEVKLTTPKQDESYQSTQAVSISADVNNEVQKVEFWADNTKIGEATKPPYTFNWSKVAAGTYNIVAKAIETTGKVISSATARIVVTEPKQEPPANDAPNNGGGGSGSDGSTGGGNDGGSSTACEGTGSIKLEIWKNITTWKGSIAIPENRKPDREKTFTSFTTTAYDDDLYVARMRGYICPPTTGNYTFYLSGDDYAELWISDGPNPASKKRIIKLDNWSDFKQYDRYGASQRSQKIYLEAGKLYYIEGLYQELYGHDHLSVGWQLPNGNFQDAIPGKNLIAYSGVIETPKPETPQKPDNTPVPNEPTQGNTCSGTGGITWEYFYNVPANAPMMYERSNNYKPNGVRTLTSFASPRNFADYYAGRAMGYICPPETGNYTFYLSSDDQSELWISSDENPENMRKIAYVNGWTSYDNYNQYSSQKSATVYLQAGKRYFIETVHIDAGGDDHLSVAWRLPSGTFQAPIAGKHLVPYEAAYAKSSIAGNQGVNTLSLKVEEKVAATNSLDVAPNPVQSAANLRFSVAESGTTVVELYNAQGSLVKRLFNGTTQNGQTYQVPLDGSSLPNGLYLVRLVSGNTTLQKQVIIAH